MSNSLKESWDRISQDYQARMRIPTDDVYWGEFVASERQLKLLGEVKGKKILEICCGGAQNSIALLKWGAEVYGIDLSRKQILYGKRLARKEKRQIDLIVGNAEKLPFKNGYFDMVITAISLLYVPNLAAAISEVNRVLRRRGYFVFSNSHPLVEGKLVRYKNKPALAIRRYFKRRIVRWTDKLQDGFRVKMHSYYRTLQDYFDALFENGFLVERYIELERLEEKDLHALDVEDLRNSRNARQLYKTMKEIPYWIVFKTRKTRNAF